MKYWNLNEQETQLETYRKALEQIAELANVTQVRGGFMDLGVPDSQVDPEGWVPIHPMMKIGLEYAATIANRVLSPLAWP